MAQAPHSSHRVAAAAVAAAPDLPPSFASIDHGELLGTPLHLACVRGQLECCADQIRVKRARADALDQQLWREDVQAAARAKAASHARAQLQHAAAAASSAPSTSRVKARRRPQRSPARSPAAMEHADVWLAIVQLEQELRFLRVGQTRLEQRLAWQTKQNLGASKIEGASSSASVSALDSHSTWPLCVLHRAIGIRRRQQAQRAAARKRSSEMPEAATSPPPLDERDDPDLPAASAAFIEDARWAAMMEANAALAAWKWHQEKSAALSRDARVALLHSALAHADTALSLDNATVSALAPTLPSLFLALDDSCGAFCHDFPLRACGPKVAARGLVTNVDSSGALTRFFEACGLHEFAAYTEQRRWRSRRMLQWAEPACGAEPPVELAQAPEGQQAWDLLRVLLGHHGNRSLLRSSSDVCTCAPSLTAAVRDEIWRSLERACATFPEWLAEVTQHRRHEHQAPFVEES